MGDTDSGGFLSSPAVTVRPSLLLEVIYRRVNIYGGYRFRGVPVLTWRNSASISISIS